jgi:signal transduction histidine kinase
MDSLADWASGLRKQLLKRWWWIVVLIGLYIVALEMFIHGAEQLLQPDAAFRREMIFIAISFPLLGGAIFGLLAYGRSEDRQSAFYLDLHRKLNQQLSEAPDWERLEEVLLQFPRLVLPVVSTALMLYDPNTARYQRSAVWSLDGNGKARLVLEPPEAERYWPGEGSLPVRYDGSGYPNAEQASSNEAENAFYLPLPYGNKQVAMLHLCLPENTAPTIEQVKFLTSIAPQIAMAVEGMQLQRSIILQSEANEAERERIARDLHDTLGQNLAFLRLKLDQMTYGDALSEITASQQELKRMRDIAEEAYEQVRDKLVSLQPDRSPNLEAALLHHARKVAARAHFEVDLVSEGQPRVLPDNIQRHILYIFREALANVEKHANARRVDIRLSWAERSLTIDISDDGKGFDPEKINLDGHYGLTIMRERAEEINAHLTITSSEQGGTHLSLTVIPFQIVFS